MSKAPSVCTDNATERRTSSNSSADTTTGAVAASPIHRRDLRTLAVGTHGRFDAIELGHTGSDELAGLRLVVHPQLDLDAGTHLVLLLAKPGSTDRQREKDSEQAGEPGDAA